MRWSLLIVLVAIPTLASARPTLAVAPLDGDRDGNIGEIVADAAADHGKTTRPDKVSREISKLDISSLDAKSVKKLRIKLEADVIIYGTVEKQGSRKHLELTLTGHGKARGKLEVDFKTTKILKKQLEAKLGQQIDVAAAGADDDRDDDDDGAASKRKQREAEEKKRRDDEEEKKRRDDDEKKQREESTFKKKKHDDDPDDGDRKHKTKKHTASRDDDTEVEEDSSIHRKKKRHHRDDDEEDEGATEHPRHALTQASLWADVGAAFARRTLTYAAGGNQKPPPVGTAAAAGEVEGEVYPAAFTTLKGPLAGIGIAGAFDRTVGLGIAVPGTTVVAPIKNGFYWIGARYRFTFGGSSIAVGASYWSRYYIADRSKLMMPTQLDMPDVEYKALAPDVTARFAATPKIGVFAALQLPLMLSSGPIQTSTSYGPSTILAFDLRSGVQIALGSHYALQIALGFDQIGIKFTAKQGSQAALREVSAATDRSLGLAATLGVMY